MIGRIAMQRLGPFIEVVDDEGRRHLVRISSIQWLSDTDSLRDETLITAAGRTVHIREPLDEIIEQLHVDSVA